ncbi:early nodulin-like protein 1 [Olea europaea var. sylvestris]|uniref:early nodulin-like protein 1 n=1 Tax=Olea europaea var. sylvestris TaxID=158386 RepID=UPI000C1D826F|nr:early nodulin-like protein 1 [Olea europaea var. sylvestris]
MDCTTRPRICQEMPKNLAASLLRPGCVPDMIRDSLVLKYDSKTDSVLEVIEEDYKICNNANPIKSHHDGETIISLEKLGLFFFISGAKEHCQKGQKLAVMVLSDKYGSSNQSTAQAPSPHHHRHHYHAPAPAPTNGGTGLKVAVGFICGTVTVGSLVSLSREFVVGCENNLWAVPSSVDEFNKWAKKTHFQIGDSLVLKHNSKTHSVLEVNEEDYKICNNANLIKSHNDRENQAASLLWP